MNKLLFILICSFVFQAHATGFRNERDRAIVHDILKTFGKECALRAASEGDILRRLETEASTARRARNAEVLKCFEATFSQISGVFNLYQKICNDVSTNPSKVTDSLMARQLLEISKYQSGIRPYQSVMNDCLLAIPERRVRNFVVPLAGTELDVRALQNQLDEINVKDPFPAMVEPFR